jgi:hypothetical protein
LNSGAKAADSKKQASDANVNSGLEHRPEQTLIHKAG